jgi:hypothetical protein
VVVVLEIVVQAYSISADQSLSSTKGTAIQWYNELFKNANSASRQQALYLHCYYPSAGASATIECLHVVEPEGNGGTAGRRAHGRDLDEYKLECRARDWGEAEEECRYSPAK